MLKLVLLILGALTCLVLFSPAYAREEKSQNLLTDQIQLENNPALGIPVTIQTKNSYPPQISATNDAVQADIKSSKTTEQSSIIFTVLSLLCILTLLPGGIAFLVYLLSK